MPATQPAITRADAVDRIRHAAFPPDAGAHGAVGVELERLTVPVADPSAPADHQLVRDCLDALELPGRSRLTFEPGGQVEVSSPPFVGVGPACDVAARDLAVVADALLDRCGVALVGRALDLRRSCRRVVDSGRYRAMEAWFDAVCGPDGRRMMCATAAVQVNLDAGTGELAGHRWRRAGLAGPVLAAAFAASPVAGWRSGRLAAWLGIDPSRTRPVPVAPGSDPGRAWAEYALAARVLFVRRAADECAPVLSPLTFDQWLAGGSPWGWPTFDDVDEHVTTLFPPVRPRGWLELRMIDGLPDPWWRAAVAVATALVDDDDAFAAAEPALLPTAGLWRDAAAWGLDEPRLAAGARAAFLATIDALGRIGADDVTAEAVSEYLERFVPRAAVGVR